METELYQHTNKDAIVVLSGGQDSVTCLGWALKNYNAVSCIAFDYGQRHKVELQQAEKICDLLEVRLDVHTIPSLEMIGDSALIGDKGDVNDKHPSNHNLPSSFVPNRNALFLTIAHAYAQKLKAEHVITGVCETDYSGYPDCRNDFIRSLEETLNLGYETDIKFMTPLMYLNKAQTFKLANDVNFLPIVIEDSHTCYNGKRDKIFKWGHGCGECPACSLRAKGFEDYLALVQQSA